MRGVRCPRSHAVQRRDGAEDIAGILEQVDEDGDGELSLDEFIQLNKINPRLLQPATDLQKNLRKKMVLGEKFCEVARDRAQTYGELEPIENICSRNDAPSEEAKNATAKEKEKKKKEKEEQRKAASREQEGQAFGRRRRVGAGQGGARCIRGGEPSKESRRAREGGRDREGYPASQGGTAPRAEESRQGEAKGAARAARAEPEAGRGDAEIQLFFQESDEGLGQAWTSSSTRTEPRRPSATTMTTRRRSP